MIYLGLAAFIVVCGTVMIWPTVFVPIAIKSHNGVSENLFVGQLASDGIPEYISALVFTYYKKKARFSAFNPSPGMNIIDVFGELPEDIDDTAVELLQQLHLEVPYESWSGGDVRTAGDMAKWLYWASNHQPI